MTDTRENIIRLALKLFLLKGYKEVTLKDIITETGLSKGAFYHYFESKEMLYREIVDRFWINGFNFDYPGEIPDNKRLVDLLIDYFDSLLGQLEALANEFGVESSSMNVYAFIFDIIKYYPNIVTTVGHNHVEEVKCIEKLIDFAKKRNEVKYSIDSGKLANHIHTVIHGVFMLSFIEPSNVKLRDSFVDTFEHLYSLIKQ